MKNLFRLIIISFIIVLCSSRSFAQDCIFSLHGNCYNCNSQYALKLGTQANCEEKCTNRIYIAKDRSCNLKIGATQPFPAANDTSINNNYCETYISALIKRNKGSDEPAKSGIYFKGQNGKCYKCSTAEAVDVSNVSSSTYFSYKSCDQRLKKHYSSKNVIYSVLKCPSDKPLMDRFMMCWSCNEPTPIDLSFDTEFNDKFCKNKRILEGPYSHKK